MQTPFCFYLTHMRSGGDLYSLKQYLIKTYAVRAYIYLRI